MIPIKIHPLASLPSRFSSIDDSMRTCKTLRGVSFIYPKRSITTNPNARIQVSTLALHEVSDEHFWNVQRHLSDEVPLLIGTQFGIMGLSQFTDGVPRYIGTIGMSVLSGCVAGFSFRAHDTGNSYRAVPLTSETC